MLSLRTDTYSLNKNGNAQHELFADISTRKLESITVGESCGKVSKGKGNAFVGFESGKHNFEGSFGVFVGFQAGSFNQNGNWNTYIGAYAGQKNNRGSKNTFIGFNAGQFNADGSECTAIGVNAMRENSLGNRNVAVGINAGERILEGDDNTMVGAEAGQNIRSGNLNTMAGFRAGRGAFRGNENTYFGAYSGYSNSEGNANSFIGYRSGEFLTIGDYNVAVGAYTMRNLNDGSYNIAIGAFAGTNVSGSGNVLLGTNAASSKSLGDDNTIVGKNAADNTIGDRNVVIGADAFNIGTFDINEDKSNISYNSVIIGYKSASTIFDEGSNNIFIGCGADSTSGKTTNAIVIGSINTLGCSNSISIGTSIRNLGQNSILLGADMYSDSTNCVSLGNNIDVNNVNAFIDFLNKAFPIDKISGNETFKITAEYTDTLGDSNGLPPLNVATAGIYVENEYNSKNYDSLLNGISVPAISSKLYNAPYILYRPLTIKQTENTIDVVFKDYAASFNPILIKTSGNDVTYETNIDDSNILISNTNISENDYSKTINVTYTNSLNDEATVTYNLIPAVSNNFAFDFNIHVARRINIKYDSSVSGASYTLLPDAQSLIIPVDRSTETDETEFMSILNDPAIALEYKYYINDKPKYGVFNSNVFVPLLSETTFDIIYKRHLESLYAIDDTYSIAVVNDIKLNGTRKHSIIRENLITSNIIFNSSTDIIYATSNIYLHPDNKTVFDRSYFNKIYTFETDEIVVSNIHSNLVISYNGNALPLNSNINLNEFYNSSFLIEFNKATAAANTNTINELAFDITINSVLYSFYYTYLHIVDIPYITDSVIDIPTFSVDTINISAKLALDTNKKPYIIDNPEYGVVRVTETYVLTYTPTIFNFGNDTLTIFQDTIGYRRILIRTSQTITTTIDFHKVQEDIDIIGTVPEGDSVITRYIDMYDNIIYIEGGTNNYNQTKRIPTIILQNTTLYTYNISKYTIIDPSNVNVINPNLHIYKSPDGPVTEFTQEDIREKRIHIYNTGSSEEYTLILYDAENTNNKITLKLFYYYPINYIFVRKSRTIAINFHNGNSTTFPIVNRYINHSYNIAFIRDGDNTKLLLIDPNISNSYFEYFDYLENFNTTVSTDIVRVSVTEREFFVNNPIHFNGGFENTTRLISKKDLIFIKEIVDTNGNQVIIQPNNIIFEYRYFSTATSPFYKNSSNADNIKVTIFSQEDINYNRIYIQNSSTVLLPEDINSSVVISFDILNGLLTFNESFNTYTLSILGQTFSDTNNAYIHRYYQNNFIEPSVSHNNIVRNVNLNDKYKCELTGELWGSLVTTDVTIHILVPPENGFIYIEDESNSQPKYSITNAFTYDKLANNIIKMYYIPYEPMNLVNDKFTCFFSYLNKVSPVYRDINIHNYWSKWGQLEQSIISPRLLDFSRSSGLIENDISWSIIENIAVLGLSQDIKESPTFTSDVLYSEPNTTLDMSNSNWDMRIGWKARASTQLNEYPVWKVFNKTVTDETDCWLINHNLSSEPEWLELEYPYPVTVKSYSITSRNDVTDNVFYPREWRLQAHDGTTWIDLENTRTEINWLPATQLMYSDNINIFFNAYKRYRLLITVSSGESFLAIGDWTLFNREAVGSVSIVSYSEQIRQRPLFKSLDTFSMQVPNGGFLYFNELSSNRIQHYDTIMYNINVDSNYNTDIDGIKANVYYFIINPPREGAIFKGTGTDINPVAYFTEKDIQDKTVFYQHFGTDTTFNDSFDIQIGTSEYDLSVEKCTININVIDGVFIENNKYGYIYYDTIDLGKETYNLLDSSLLKLSTSGSINVFNLININLYLKVQDTYIEDVRSFTNEQLVNGMVYYRPSPTFFESGSNINQEMSFNFTTSDNITDTSKLVSFPKYQELFTNKWIAKYNTYESINTELPVNQNISSIQEILYTSEVPLSLNDNKTAFEFEYNPYTPMLILAENQLSSNVVNTINSQKLHTYKFKYEMLNTNDEAIFFIEFSESSIKINSTQFTINKTDADIPPSLFTMNAWKKVRLVNNDITNDERLSFYIDDYNYTPFNKIPESSHPTMEGLNDLKTIRLSVSIYDNAIWSSDSDAIITGSEIIDNNDPNKVSVIYYSFKSYPKIIYFRNFKILTQSFGINTVYNVVIGDRLDINGYNNICIGQNFSTLGKGSVIIGNDIGGIDISSLDTVTSSSQFEILNSIIISTSSFRNTEAKNVIAIGSNILNDVSIDIANGERLSALLAQNPILIGNNIGVNELDFHINLQNTFLKTSARGNHQIYCGLSNEPLCIGYTSNMDFTSDSLCKMYVNGGVCAEGPIVYSNSSKTQQVFSDIFFQTGTSHVCRLQIQFATNSVNQHTSFTVKGTFRLIKDQLNYALYKFENWLNPLSVDGLLYVIDWSDTVSGDILNIRHVTSKDITGYINIDILWDTSIALTPESYMSGVMEVESVTPSALGGVVFKIL